MHDTELCRGVRRSRPGLRMEDLQRSDRREDGGNPQRLPHEGGGWVNVRHVDQDTRPEGDAVEGEPIPPQGRFRLGTAHQIVPGALVLAATCYLDNFLITDKIETHVLVPSVRSCS